MTRTFADLKRAVVAYVNRDELSLVRGGFNCLENAINDAKMWAQRTHIFEKANVEITVPDVNLTSGADLSTAVLRGTTTAVLVRALKHAWLPAASGTGEVPLEIISRDQWVNEQKRRFDRVLTSRREDWTSTTSDGKALEVVYNGTKIHLSTANTEALNGASDTDIHFDAVRWFDVYENDTDTDFLLQYAFDFLLMRTVFQLNFYLKEDQRVPVNAEAMNDAWLSVIRWDTSLVVSSTSPRLD